MGGAEFGSRTRARQSYVSGRSSSPYTSSPQSNPYLSTYPQPFTAFSGQTQQQFDNILYEEADPYSSSKSARSQSSPSSVSSLHHTTLRRQLSSSDLSDDSRTPSRSASRFEAATNPPTRSRSRTRLGFRSSRFTTTEQPTTTQSSRFNRFRPRTTLNSARSISNTNRFNSVSRPRESLFNSRDNTRNRFGSTTSTRNSLFTRGKVVDYDDYDYYDYEDTNLQSSQSGVPDFITVTHLVPVATQIPVIEFGNTEFRDILSSSPSLEVVAVTALKSTDINESPVIYANAHTLTPQPGIKDIQFDALRATETTTVTFTPTRIGGRRTSFQHILPTTIYNVETVSTRIVEPVDQNSLLNSLLQQLLLGGATNPSQQNQQPLGPIQTTQATEFVTHTSTYVPTITTEDSTIIPITFRGREVTTTLVESSTQVITATEFSTETVVQNVPVIPTPAAVLPQIVQTQAPNPALANPQIASLIPAILGAQQANLLSQQQQQEAALLAQQQKIQDLLQQQEEALLAKQFQDELEQFAFADSLTEAEQEALNEQILAKINLDDFTDEELANLDLDAVVDAVTGSSSSSISSLKHNPLVFPKKNLFGTSPVSKPQEIQPESPKSSVVTIFKSGSTPGDFTRVFSTIYFDEKRRRKGDTLENDINPNKPIFVTKTQALEDSLDSGIYILGGPRGPVSADIFDSVSDSYIQSGLNPETETAILTSVIPTMSLELAVSQHP